MTSYNQIIKVKSTYNTEAKNFFSFLQSVGKGRVSPVEIKYRYLGRGRFSVVIYGGDFGGIDALLQELILNRGLYYYVCSIAGNKKKEVINYAVIPIFQELLERRFQNPYSRFLKRHILAKISQEKFVPGEFSDPFSHEYEILFRKWDMGMISGWDFVKDVDAFLNKFMLIKTEHVVGQPSRVFDKLVDEVYKRGIGMVKETKNLFKQIHKKRTKGLHRLKTDITKEEISSISFQIYNYFQYFDEFQESQREKTDILHGKRYRRIKYGDEKWLDKNGEPYKDENGQPYFVATHPCHDCAAIKGQYHCSGCDVEQCPRCKEQRLGCSCKLRKDFD